MSVRGKIWENIPSVRITISVMYYGGARQGAFKTLGPSGWASLYLYSSPYLPSRLGSGVLMTHQNCYFPEAMKQEQQLGTGSISSSLQIKTFFIDIIYMAPLEIIIRAKLVRYKYEYLVYYVCNKQPNMCSRLILLCLGIRVFYA
jgi:hypothetical protein